MIERAVLHHHHYDVFEARRVRRRKCLAKRDPRQDRQRGRGDSCTEDHKTMSSAKMLLLHATLIESHCDVYVTDALQFRRFCSANFIDTRRFAALLARGCGMRSSSAVMEFNRRGKQR